MRTINLIVLHCSASDNPAVDAAEIDRWHRLRGFRCIGYHYFIKTDGMIELGRPLEQIGAHVEGSNIHSIGICLNGLSIKSFTEIQFESLRQVLKALRARFPKAEIKGHTELNPAKTCPVFDTAPFKEFWRSLP
jgi:N-acetylmuramoyl-L-alanine amidase